MFLRTFKAIGCYHILSLDKPRWIGKRSYQCGTDQIPDVDNQSCLTYDGGLQQDMMLDFYSNASSFVHLFICFHYWKQNAVSTLKFSSLFKWENCQNFDSVEFLGFFFFFLLLYNYTKKLTYSFNISFERFFLWNKCGLKAAKYLFFQKLMQFLFFFPLRTKWLKENIALSLVCLFSRRSLRSGSRFKVVKCQLRICD